MYTLRRISSEGVEMNHYLGKIYTVVDSKKSPEIFKRDVEMFTDKEGIFAIVSNEDGSFIQPLFKRQKNYIMTDSGKTLDCLI